MTLGLASRNAMPKGKKLAQGATQLEWHFKVTHIFKNIFLPQKMEHFPSRNL